MSELLVVENLKRSFRDGQSELHVLKGVSLKVGKGDFLAIRGPSGAGKSTLLHLLGALDKPTDGKVCLNGTDIHSLSDNALAGFRNRMIGFVFQFYHLFPEFSVLENVMAPAMVAGRKTSGEKRALELLERVGLADRINHSPDKLSAGEMQRVAIARALVNNPEIVFADEPTGNLDSDNGENFFGLIQELNEKERRTFIIATHEDALAKRAKRVMTLVDGILV